MDSRELTDICKCGETSKVQFKELFTSQKQVAEEMIAFANSKGGIIVFGVKDKTGTIVGMDYDMIQTTSREVANAANEQVRPTIYIQTEVVSADDNKCLVVTIAEGKNKPYKDLAGNIWVKQGADKRRITENSEILSLFQDVSAYNPDKMKVADSDLSDIDLDKAGIYIKKVAGRPLGQFDDQQRILRNLHIITKEGLPTMAGILFFGKTPQLFYPSFIIKAVSFIGNDIAGTKYRDSKDIEGNLTDMFDKGMSFMKANLHSIQDGQSFNSIGNLEIPEEVLEEALQNALVHRDYLKMAPIRVLIFDNRVEIKSPGTLAGGLSLAMIEEGDTYQRNPLLASICSTVMAYRGLGSGILRIKSMYPSAIIREEENHFVVVLPRQLQGNEGENRENEGAIHNNEGVIHNNDGVIAGNDTVNVNSDIVKSASFDGVIEGLKLIAQKSGLEMNAKHVSILKAILSNSKVTVQEISKIIEKSESTVERHIRDMRGIVLDRKGADKNGEWVILGNN